MAVGVLFLRMPRRSRCILPGLPCHVTQRGVNRCETFSLDQDRSAYLRMLRETCPIRARACWAGA